MSLTPQEITLDLNPSFTQMQTVHCSQYDDKIRQIIVKLKDGGTNIDVSSYTIYIEGTKPDKHGFSYPLTEIGSVSSNTVTFYIQLQMCAVPGMTRMEVVLKSGTDRIGSANFMLAVERAGLQDDTNTSDSELAPYINGAETAAQEAAQSASDSEAWAVGKRNGADVDSSDVTYHNNSKYYSDQVSGSLPAIQAEIDAVDDRVDGLSLDYYEETNPITHQRTEVGISLTKDGQYTDVAIWGTNSTIPEATTSKNGWMSATDKTDLTNAKANVTDLQGRVTTLEGEMDTAQEDIADLQTKASETPTAIYPEMMSGGVYSEKVLSSDNSPYLYRLSGNGKEVGIAEDNTIVGGSVAWNQLIDSYAVSRTVKGLTFTNNGTSISINGTITEAFDFGNIVLTNYSLFKRDGTKYLILLSKRVPHKIGIAGFTQVYALNSDGFIWTNTNGGTWNGAVGFIQTEVNQQFSVDNLSISVFDLTRMFGSTVADYLYSLETATAGAGVAVFRKMFPNAYYPYNAGELMHVSGVSEHVMTGYNRFDINDMIPQTHYNTDGVLETQTYRCSTPLIPIEGTLALKWSTTLTVSINAIVCQFDGSQNLIYRSVPTSTDNGFVFALQASTKYVGISFYSQSGNINGTLYDVLVAQGSDNTYEPYKSYTYPLDSTLTLRGIPKLSNGEIYYDGDTYESDGTVTRKYGIVDLGTLTWVYDSALHRHRGIVPNIKRGIAGDIANLMCSKYITMSQYTINNDGVDKAVSTLNWTDAVLIADSAYTDSASFKTAVSGTYLVYELATPTTETAEPFSNPQYVIEGGTEQYVSTSIVPVGHITEYHGEKVADLTETLLNNMINVSTASANPLSFNDGADSLPVKDCVVNIQPSQPNAYDSVWVGGAGKNLLSADLVNGTQGGLTFTTVNNPSFTVSGTWSSVVYRALTTTLVLSPNTSYTISGGSASMQLRIREFDSASNVLATTTVTGSTTFTTNANTVRCDVYAVVYSLSSTTTVSPIICLSTASNPTVFTPYSNICPISGWTSANIHRCGVNQWDEEWTGGWIGESGNVSSSTVAWVSKNYIPVSPSATYYLKNNGNAQYAVRVVEYDVNKQIIKGTVGWWHNVEKTMSANTHFIKIARYETSYNHDISINYPSTDTSYHAYTGTTYSVDLSSAGTVYGGTLDVTTGVLTVDRTYVKKTLSQRVTQVDETNTTCFTFSNFFTADVVNAEGGVTTGMCSLAEYKYNTNDTPHYYFSTARNLRIWLPKGIDTSTEIEASAVLTTPITYHLTPTEVTTLLKNNTLTANCGTVSLSYYADTKSYIDNAIATAVASL